MNLLGTLSFALALALTVCGSLFAQDTPLDRTVLPIPEPKSQRT
jgi:hypothetical protein